MLYFERFVLWPCGCVRQKEKQREQKEEKKRKMIHDRSFPSNTKEGKFSCILVCQSRLFLFFLKKALNLSQKQTFVIFFNSFKNQPNGLFFQNTQNYKRVKLIIQKLILPYLICICFCIKYHPFVYFLRFFFFCNLLISKKKKLWLPSCLQGQSGAPSNLNE